MIMKYNNRLKRFELTASYMEFKMGYLAKVKAAGFRFEKEPVAVWHTDDPTKAALLVSCADENAKSMLEVRASQMASALMQSRAHDADLGDLLNDLTMEPYPFQKAGIAYGASRKRVFITDEPGLGKSLESLALVHINQAYPCIAVVPTSLRINWRKEAIRAVPELTEPDAIQILSGETMKNPDGSEININPKAKFIIIGYSVLHVWLPKLVAIKAKSLIADESHMAKNGDSLRTQALLELAEGIKYVKKPGNVRKTKIRVNDGIEYRYLLSGTPEPNRVLELEPQLEILGIIDMLGGKGGFRMRYCGPEPKTIYVRGGHGETRTVYEFKGASHQDELQRRLRECVMVRRLKDDVLTELPPKRHQCIELPANGAQSLIDRENEVEETFNRNVESLKQVIEQATKSGDEKSFAEASARLKKHHEAHFSEMAKLSHDIGMAKVPYVIQYCLELLETEGKIAIGIHHHDVADALAKAFKEAKIKTVSFTGRESDAQKNKAIDAFQNGDARVWIGAISCGVGYTITAAKRMIMAEELWTPAAMDQMADRIHRIGQKDSVLITYIVLEDSLDAKKVGMLIDKKETSYRILDKPLEDFTVPSGSEPEKQNTVTGTHVFEILARLGINENIVPF